MLKIILILLIASPAIADTEFNFQTGQYETTINIDEETSFDHKGYIYHTEDHGDYEYRFNFKDGKGEYRYKYGDVLMDKNGNRWKKIED